jgi:hypothetical protein
VAIAPIVEPVKPKATAPAIIITKESVAQEKKSYQSMTAIPTNEAVTAPVTTNAMVAQAPPSATNAISALPVAESKPAAVAVKTAPSTPTNKLAVAALKSEPILAEPIALAAAVAAPVAPASPSPLIHAATTPAGTPAGALLWAVIGAGGALICVLVVFLAYRSRRPAPSLISQSLVRERAGRTPA